MVRSQVGRRNIRCNIGIHGLRYLDGSQGCQKALQSTRRGKRKNCLRGRIITDKSYADVMRITCSQSHGGENRRQYTCYLNVPCTIAKIIFLTTAMSLRSATGMHPELSMAITTSIQSFSMLQGHSRSARPTALARCVVVVDTVVVDGEVDAPFLVEPVKCFPVAVNAVE